MKVPLVDLQTQYQGIKREVLGKIEATIEKGDFILGEEVKKFEQEFATYIGVKYGIGVASGTDALYLSLLACGIRPGDEVITSATTFIATVEAISMTQATPVLVDIDPKTYNIDPAKIEKAITKKTRLIIPVHLCGQPADMDKIMALAKKYSLKIIEDAAQAHGAVVRDNKKAGSWGDLACFSFYPAKNLGAYGDGGMVVTSNPSLAEKVRILRDHGQAVKNQHRIRGFNSRLDNLQAAILRIKLKCLDEWNNRRRQNARIYQELFLGSPAPKGTDVLLPQPAPGDHIYHLYIILAKNRDKLAEWLKSREIFTGMHYPQPVHLQECYQDLGYGIGDFPVSEEYAEKTLSLPIYPELTRDQIKWVVDSVKEFYY